MLQTYVRPSFVLQRGEGCYLYDTEGRRYLDFVAGIAVNALGYGDPTVTQVIAEQSQALMHVSNLYYTEPPAELARMLVETSFADRVFFSNSGAEAVEGALKFARKYAYEHHKKGKTTIVSFTGSFHGRTMGAVAVTSKEKYREPFAPVMPGVRFAEYNDLQSAEKAITDDVCAVIVEPVQGEGGLSVATHDFYMACASCATRWARCSSSTRFSVGMGRTGTLWAYEQYDVTPDIMTVAKPLGGGLPIGAVLMKQAVADVMHPGDHGTTFGGGPLVTAVAQVVLHKISDPAFLAHVREISDYLDESLHDLASSHSEIIELRGRGLMRGVRIDGSAGAVREAGHEEGLLTATAGEDVLRLVPPLIIEREHVDEAMQKLGKALRCA